MLATNLGRRGFLGTLGEASAGILASPLERFVQNERNQTSRDSRDSALETSSYDASTEIARLIKKSIEEHNRNVPGYKNAYNYLSSAIEKCKKSYKGLNWKDEQYITIKSLEAIAYARIGNMLLESVGTNKAMPYEKYKLISNKRGLNNEQVKFQNLYEAYKSYEQALSVIEEALNNGKKLPSWVRDDILGHYGIVPKIEWVKEKLQKTKDEIRKVYERLDKEKYSRRNFFGYFLPKK